MAQKYKKNVIPPIVSRLFFVKNYISRLHENAGMASLLYDFLSEENRIKKRLVQEATNLEG